ncbi:MAG: carboxypeptidase-like regulatory domain-containing protein [Gemmatimonadetes bacterium]|nr:carboxypeptidase-like regulatory domain-containing protein [Gemmatimonadota bacterium]
MKLNRTNVVPLLAIVAGGAIGASLSFSFLALTRSGVEPEPFGTVTGQVTDAQSGVSLAAVQVYIDDLRLGSLSQPNGRYLLLDVPAGTHTLTVVRMGYRTVEEQITIGGGQTVEQNFSVAEEAVQLDPLVVPGTPEPISPRRFSSILIGNQPIIYVDGIRVDNSFGLGPDHGSDGLRNVGGSGGSALDDINPEDIESIEIIKGPEAAKLYGTEASAGVIQIITKKERYRTSKVIGS